MPDLEVKIDGITPKRMITTPRAGLYLTSPHASKIASGEKKAIVKSKKLTQYINEPVYLIQDKICFGIIALQEPISINQTQFKKLRNKHLISDKEADKWSFSSKSQLYYYDVTPHEIWRKARTVRIPKGAQIWIKAENIKFPKLPELTDGEVYIQHSNFHNSPSLEVYDLHDDYRLELETRHLPHRSIDWLDSPLEELIKDIDYDVSKPNAQQLADDWRIVSGWYSTIKRGKNFKYTEEQVKNLAVKIAREIIKRVKEGKMKHTFRPRQMKKYPGELFEYIMKKIGKKAFFPGVIEPDIEKLTLKELLEVGNLAKLPEYPEQVDPHYLEEISDKDLKNVYEWIHKVFRERGKITEDLFNANLFILMEMKERHIKIEPKDELDEKTLLEAIEYPTPKGIQLDKSITLQEVLEAFPNIFELTRPPSQIYIAGRIVNLEEIPPDHDIDIIIKQNYPDQRLVDEIVSQVPEWLGKRLHFTFDPEGPRIGYNIPLYNLAYKRAASKRLSPWDIASFAAKPTLFRQFIGIKPKSGLGKLEFWDVKEMWNKWGSSNIDRGIVVQEKLDGRRFFIHMSKADKKVKIITEDRMRDRAKQFPNVIKDALSSINAKSVILDTEALVYDLGGKKVSKASSKRKLGELIPREDSVPSWSPIIIRNLKTKELDILPISDLISFEDSKKEWKRIENFEIYSSSWTKLKAIGRHPSIDKSIVRINTVGGGVDVTGNHSLIDFEERIVKPSNLRKGSRLSYPSLIHTSDSVKDKDQSEEGWILGLLVADGSISKHGTSWQIELVNQNKDLINRARNLLQKIYDKEIHLSFSKKDKCFKLYFGSKEIGKKLRDLIYTSEGFKRVPKFILNSSELTKLSFLEGYFLGDGGEKNRGKGVFDSFSSDSQTLILGIMWLLKEVLDLEVGVNYNRKTSSWNINVVRTHNLAPDLVKKYLRIPYEGFLYDISTKDESFMTGMNIRVHNTAALSGDELTVGAVSEEMESNTVFAVHDIVYLDGEAVNEQGYSDRYKLIQKVISKDADYLAPVNSTTVSSGKAFLRAVEKMRRLHGSEGVVAKTSDSIYKIKYSGENRTSDWCKLKNLKEIDVMVWNRVSKKTKAGKELDQYMYDSVFQIPVNMKDKFKTVYEWQGKYYSPIGRSYATSKKASKGDIITIRPVRIRIYEKQDKLVVTWMFPTFDDIKKDKIEPDTWTTVKRIAKAGTAPLSAEIIELDDCPYWDNITICPLRERFFIPGEDEVIEEALAKTEYLKYPIKCALAYRFKCKYVKDYYFGVKELEDFADSISSEVLEAIDDSGVIMTPIPDSEPKFETSSEIELVAPKYLEIPPGNRPTPFVMQSHTIGKSQHLDFRFKVDDHLNGWSWVGGNIEKPIVPSRMTPKKGFRCETKARQPLMWLRVEGEVKPGEVGGGVEAGGRFEIVEKGKIVLGAQKPYFHEYFVKGTKHFKNWTRIVIRGIRVQRLDPKTKKPIKGKYEMLWRGMVPETMEPYAISTRAIKRGWKPPKNQKYPFPYNWVKEKYPKKLEEWEEWIKGKKTKSKELKMNTHKECKNFKEGICILKNKKVEPDGEACDQFSPKIEASGLIESKTIDYVLHQNSWKGPFHIRGVPELQWYLRLKTNGIRSWYISEHNPIHVAPVAAQYEGKVPSKWFDYEGLIKPGERYNPLKELDTRMIILTRGKVELTTEILQGKEVISLKFKSGKLRGNWILEQEQKKADMYVFAPEKALATKGRFVLQKHGIPTDEKDYKWHFDLRWDSGANHLDEINLYGNPIKEKRAIRAVKKKCYDKTWMDIEDEEKRKVGGIWTIVEAVDEGKISIIEDTERFVSMFLQGEALNGYYILKKEEEGWKFMESQLPKPHSLEEEV